MSIQTVHLPTQVGNKPTYSALVLSRDKDSKVLMQIFPSSLKADGRTGILTPFNSEMIST